MIQVVPNATELEGTIVSRSGHPTLDAYDVLSVDVRQTKPVSGLADLLSSSAGSTIEIAVKREQLPADTSVGAPVSFRAALRGPGAVFAEPGA
jgi:hypothetical protein